MTPIKLMEQQEIVGNPIKLDTTPVFLGEPTKMLRKYYDYNIVKVHERILSRTLSFPMSVTFL